MESFASIASIASSPLIEILERVHREFLAVRGGEVATYIPELANADPNQFGIAVATVDGKIFVVGDADAPFTIQSISKPLVFGMALAEQGGDAVLSRVGVEPSGNPFNSVTVDAASNRPFNPMVNAGAIVTTALVAGQTRPSDSNGSSTRSGSSPAVRSKSTSASTSRSAPPVIATGPWPG